MLVTNSEWGMFNKHMRHLQFLALRPLLESKHAHKVYFFTLATQSSGCKAAPVGREYQIYMHAKTVLVDDEFLLTGSMGLERAGLTNDHEVGLGIHSCRFAASYRRRLSAEYLQLPEDHPMLRNYSEGFAAWVRRAQSKSGRLRAYLPGPVHSWESIGAAALHNRFEPEGRC